MTFHTFESLVPWNTAWTPTTGGFNVRATDKIEPWFVSDEQISEVDDRMPDAIRFLAKNRLYVSAELIIRLKRVWDASLHVPSMGGAMVGLREVYRIDLFRDNVRIECDGVSYTTHKSMIAGDMFLVQPEDDVSEMFVARKWLDNDHPGWHQRYLIAVSVGLTTTEIFLQMLNQEQPMSTPTLPDDLSFRMA